MTRPFAIAAVLAGMAPAFGAPACPGDAEPRDPSKLLVVRRPGQPPRALDAAALAALAPAALTQRVSVAGAASAPPTERSVAYGGVLLRDVVGVPGPAERASRYDVVVAVATDGYRAVFSAMELFNSAIGEQAIVVATQDGRRLDGAEGPLALRSLADVRPGPRHVRNLCAIDVVPAP